MPLRNLFILIILSSFLLFPSQATAFSLSGLFSSQDSWLTRLQEKIEVTLARNTDDKIKVLERQAQKRLDLAKKQAEKGNFSAATALIKSYQTVKGKEGTILVKASPALMIQAQEQTLKQQSQIEDLKRLAAPENVPALTEIQQAVTNNVKSSLESSGRLEEAKKFEEKAQSIWFP